MTLYIRRMLRQDIPQAALLDHEAFPTEWPPTNFNRELENKLAHYIVATETLFSPEEKDIIQPISIFGRIKQLFSTGKEMKKEITEQSIIGYAGMWILADEAHVTSIATLKARQRQGIGESLLIALIEMAVLRKARVVTLEARISNLSAQNLYTKFGFHKEGIRKGYYLDNHEDAVIMTTDFIQDTAFHENLERLKKTHDEKWGQPHYDLV
ncbi:MAG: ribosomal protein S18-alanine N-acetyltransferase [Dehalococcoidales bacterium]|nr:ribosomal protein S18-alanine N-acetyltransferase [Dehalococcoidales bacterium]